MAIRERALVPDEGRLSEFKTNQDVEYSDEGHGRDEEEDGRHFEGVFDQDPLDGALSAHVPVYHAELQSLKKNTI